MHWMNGFSMASDATASHTAEEMHNDIAELELRLKEAKSRLKDAQPREQSKSSSTSLTASSRKEIFNTTSHAHYSSHLAAPSTSTTHFLLLLSDSALPLGSFAFSSGLESYLAHTPRGLSSFTTFLPSSVSSYASTTLPYVLAAYRDPASLAELDGQLDASIICTVGRRASVAQGRALLSIWERSFRPMLSSRNTSEAEGLRDFATLLRESADDEIPSVAAHLGPLFGVLCALVGLSLQQTAYVFMLSHVKALVSAAVRASMFGPYQAQKYLASENTQRMIDVVIQREWDTPVEDAGQSVPVMDLWIGRHEVLYSRIFNS